MLIHLNFRNNNLVGTIPTSLGNLDHLEILYLHNNSLSGNLPPEIFGLTSLKRIFLHNNQLSGSISSNISDLISLNKFRIESNNLSGIIPQEICSLSLEWEDSIAFNISNNCFCEPLPDCVRNYQGYQDTSNCGSMHYLEDPSTIYNDKIMAYPNPFNPHTTIIIEMSRKSRVDIDIIDLLGRNIYTLFNGILESGTQKIHWNGKGANGNGIAPGIYFCTISSEYSQNVIKLILLK